MAYMTPPSIPDMPVFPVDIPSVVGIPFSPFPNPSMVFMSPHLSYSDSRPWTKHLIASATLHPVCRAYQDLRIYMQVVAHCTPHFL